MAVHDEDVADKELKLDVVPLLLLFEEFEGRTEGHISQRRDIWERKPKSYRLGTKG